MRSVKRYISNVARNSTRLQQRLSKTTQDPILLTPNAATRIKELISSKTVATADNIQSQQSNRNIQQSLCSQERQSNSNIDNKENINTKDNNNNNNATSNIDGIRIGVRTGGCNGLEYTINYNTEHKNDDVVIHQHGVKVVLENRALFYMLGTTVDYKEDDLRAGFTFDNPNVKSKCGCEQSFSV